MTIAMAAISAEGYIAVVTDRLISFGNLAHGVDTESKAWRICLDWGMLFAADNANLAVPLWTQLTNRLNRTTRYSVDEVKQVAKDVYQQMLNAEFTATKLSVYRFDDVKEFRENGRPQLGDEQYLKLCSELEHFDLGISLVIYGFDAQFVPHVFRVISPGVVVDDRLLALSVVGSGEVMALGALMAKRRARRSLNSLVYRMLEAKFASEAASGVGNSTHVLVLAPNDNHPVMPPENVEQVRGVWNAMQDDPEDPHAMGAIQNSVGTIIPPEAQPPPEAIAAAMVAPANIETDSEPIEKQNRNGKKSHRRRDRDRSQ